MEMTFIRHGKTAGNLEHRYVGRTDERLAPEGIAHIESKIKDYMYLKDIDVVFVSPMRRCQETADILFTNIIGDNYKEIVDVITVGNFREYDFGVFEEKNHEELMEMQSYRDWLDSNGSMKMPAGEGLDNFSRRVVAAFEETLKICRERNYKKAAYVVHGGTIMSIFEKYDSEKKSYYDYRCKNAEGYIAEYDGIELIRKGENK